MSTQIAVKLPERLVESLDRLVAGGAFENRSDAVRHAISALLRADQRRSIDEAFTEGFTRMPDTESELLEANRLATAAIEEEPWDPWW